ncbi:MAG TPA: ATP-binding protein [Solirubrobacteraceae bacterium]|jgi:signal transduction histidine kinase|nr:ATP-binding protein [Solirubrobacteraceae bacterium]
MRRRLVLSTALIALAALVVLGIPLALVEGARVRQENSERLEREADEIAGRIDDQQEATGTVSRALLVRATPPHHRAVVVTKAGQTVESGPSIAGDVSQAHAGSGVSGTVVVQAPTGEVEGRIHRAWLLIALLGAGGVLAAVALAALQARRLARPLEAVARGAAQLGDGDFSVRAGHFGIPEVDAIARGLDDSAERIAELVGREREFSANVSHQLRTPLTALRLRLEEAHGYGGRPGAPLDLPAALAETDRLEATIAQLLALARGGGERPSVIVDLGAAAEGRAATWRPMFARAQRTLHVATGRNVLVRASPGTLGQSIDVLLDNALRHGRGRVELAVRRDGHLGVLSVEDEGTGVDPATLPRIFERGASRAGGTGIGLHLARALLEADGGTLEVAPGRTTVFVARLPALGEVV